MRAVFISAVALGLTACQPADSRTVGEMGQEPASAAIGTQASVDAASAAPVVPGVDLYSRSDNLWKVCDEGRAVYVFEGYRRGGIAIVENAPECAK